MTGPRFARRAAVLTGPDEVVYLGQRTMDKHPIERGIAGVLKTYELLDRVRMRQDLTIRDDQFDFAVFLDAAAYARRRRIPMGVLDTGRFPVDELEGLAREGVRIWTSDEARPRPGELETLLRACRASRSFLALLLEGDWPAAGGDEPLPAQAVEGLVAAGMDLHVSNRSRKRDPGVLETLAEKARRGRSFFVYYHHGPLVEEIAGTAGRGAWVHFTDRSIPDEGAAPLACGIARAAAGSGARAVVTVERSLAPEVLENLWTAGAILRFLTPPAEAGSSLWAIERRSGKRKAPPRAVYLSGLALP